MIEERTLPQIVDLDKKATTELLKRIDFGHLGVCKDNRPYVIPIHFAYGSLGIFFYTTEGMKTEMIDANPTVCLQLEDIRSRDDWESLMITGTAERVVSEELMADAMQLIKKGNPRLAPAWSIRWYDDSIRAIHPVVYRISMDIVSGRRAFKTQVH